jgi:hypothetical protein
MCGWSACWFAGLLAGVLYHLRAQHVPGGGYSMVWTTDVLQVTPGGTSIQSA